MGTGENIPEIDDGNWACDIFRKILASPSWQAKRRGVTYRIFDDGGLTAAYHSIGLVKGGFKFHSY